MSHVLYGGPGDHTDGLIWLFDQYNKTPWWRFSHASAYPWGERLWDPVYVVGQLGYVYYWAISKLLGSVAGYNVFGFTGILLSYLVTGLFVYWRIVKSSLVAALAGYLVSFSPMALGELALGHTSYVFGAAYVVGGLWLLTEIIQGGGLGTTAVSLGLLVGSTFYFDPYFVLIIPVALMIALAGHLAFGRFRLSPNVIISLILSTLVAVILAVPGGLYLKTHHSSGLADRAGINFSNDARLYGAQISDYLLPSASNPLFPQALRDARQHSFHQSDESYVLFLSYSFMSATALAWLWLLFLKNRSRDWPLRSDPLYRLLVVLLVLAIGTWYFSLAAHLKVFGVRIYTPADLISRATNAWRNFARFDIAVWPAIVLSTLAGWVLIYRKTSQRRLIIMGGVGLAVLMSLELMPRPFFNSTLFWNYRTDLPSTYRVIADTASIRAIAEYPLREPPLLLAELYSAAQHEHGKDTLNAHSEGSPTVWYREALMDIQAPQTLPVLHALGVDAVDVYWSTDLYPHQGSVNAPNLASSRYDGRLGHYVVDLYSLAGQPKYRYMIKVDKNSRPVLEDQLVNIDYPIANGDQIEIVDLCKLGVKVNLSCSPNDAEPRSVEFDIDNSGTTSLGVLTLSKNGIAIWQGVITRGEHVIAPITGTGTVTFRLDPKVSELAISHLDVEQDYAR